MATVDDDGSSSEKPNASPPLSESIASVAQDFTEKIKILEKDSVQPSIDYAVEQAQLAQRTILDAVTEAINITKSRIYRIRDTSSAHFNQTLDSLQYLKSDLARYEDLAVEKVKEGIYVAASHPVITAGSVIGVACLGFKKPRRLLYYKMLRRLRDEEVLLSEADSKLKRLQSSFRKFKEEAEILERKASEAEAKMIRGRTKLRQAGKQIQDAARSASKIERQARGLKGLLEELPSIDASRFKAQVYNTTNELKTQKNELTKLVTKISNYGISV